MELYRHTFAAMACTAEVQLYSGNADEARYAFAAVQDEVERLEAKYSRYRDDSILTAINRGAGGAPLAIDAETAALLDYADACWRQSGGLFDITSGVLRRVWDFKGGVLPDPASLQSVLERIGWNRVRRGSGTIALEPEMEIDFGGIGKEYAADRAATTAGALGIRHGLVNLGGDLRIIGAHPDGRPWTVGITHPRDPARTIAHLQLRDGGLATSGDYERFFVRDGKRYCHILNPRTGWPCRGLASVSVMADRCLVAGTVSTIAMLKGRDGVRWLSSLGLKHYFMDENGVSGGDMCVAAPH